MSIMHCHKHGLSYDSDLGDCPDCEDDIEDEDSPDELIASLMLGNKRLGNDLHCERQKNSDLQSCLHEIVGLIENAGLNNLVNGVQLGQTSWYVKMSDAIERARKLVPAVKA